MCKKTTKLLFICSLLLLSCKSKKKLTASSNKELSKVERIQKKPKIESTKVIINETKIKAIKALRRNTMINRNKKRIPSEIITNGIGIKIRK